MDLILFGAIFWVAAIAFTALEVMEKTANIGTTVLKVLPAASAVIFVFLSTPSDLLFYLFLVVGLIFCGLGDVAMEYNILPGLGMFLFAHIFFISNFVLHSTLSTDLWTILGFVTSVGIMLIYIVMIHRYLLTAEEPTELLKAVDVYALAISMTFATSILLWLSTGTMFGFLTSIGVVSFIASDSMIGIREFHHRFRYDEPLTMITYYIAIFMIALSVLGYVF